MATRFFRIALFSLGLWLTLYFGKDTLNRDYRKGLEDMRDAL
jgi:hypothetical protein